MNTYNLALTSREQIAVPGSNLAVPVTDPSWRPVVYANHTYNNNNHTPPPPTREQYYGGWHGAGGDNRDTGPYTYNIPNSIRILDQKFGDDTISSFRITSSYYGEWTYQMLYLDEHLFELSNKITLNGWVRHHSGVRELWNGVQIPRFASAVVEGKSWGTGGDKSYQLANLTGVTSASDDADNPWYQFTAALDLTKDPKYSHQNTGSKKGNNNHIVFGKGYDRIGSIDFANIEVVANNAGSLMGVFYVPDQFGATKLNLDFTGLNDDTYRFIKILVTHNHTDKTWVLQDFNNLFSVKKKILPIDLTSSLLSETKYVVSVSAVRADLQMEVYKVNATIKRPDINNYGNVDITKTLIYNNRENSNNVLVSMETEEPRYLVNTLLRLPKTPLQEITPTLTYTDPLTGAPVYTDPATYTNSRDMSISDVLVHTFQVPSSAPSESGSVIDLHPAEITTTLPVTGLNGDSWVKMQEIVVENTGMNTIQFDALTMPQKIIPSGIPWNSSTDTKDTPLYYKWQIRRGYTEDKTIASGLWSDGNSYADNPVREELLTNNQLNYSTFIRDLNLTSRETLCVYMSPCLSAGNSVLSGEYASNALLASKLATWGSSQQFLLKNVQTAGPTNFNLVFDAKTELGTYYYGWKVTRTPEDSTSEITVRSGIWSSGKEIPDIIYSNTSPVVHEYLQHNLTNIPVSANDTIKMYMYSTNLTGGRVHSMRPGQKHHIKDIVLADEDKINPDYIEVSF